MSEHIKMKRGFLFFLHFYLWISILPLMSQNTDNADKGDYLDEEIGLVMPMPEQEPETKVLPAETKPQSKPATTRKTTQQKVVNIQPGAYQVQVQTSLILRKAPSISATQIGNLLNGTVVRVESCSKGWARINCDSGTGYVSAAYLTPYTPVQTPQESPKPKFTLSMLQKELNVFILLLICSIAILYFQKKYLYTWAYSLAIVMGLAQLGMLLFIPDLFQNIHPGAVGWTGTIIAYTCWVVASSACFSTYCKWWRREEYEDFPPNGYLLIAALTAIILTFIKLPVLLVYLAAIITSVVYHRYRSEAGFFGISLHVTACLACALTATSLIAYFII